MPPAVQAQIIDRYENHSRMVTIHTIHKNGAKHSEKLKLKSSQVALVLEGGKNPTNYWGVFLERKNSFRRFKLLMCWQILVELYTCFFV